MPINKKEYSEKAIAEKFRGNRKVIISSDPQVGLNFYCTLPETPGEAYLKMVANQGSLPYTHQVFYNGLNNSGVEMITNLFSMHPRLREHGESFDDLVRRVNSVVLEQSKSQKSASNPPGSIGNSGMMLR